MLEAFPIEQDGERLFALRDPFLRALPGARGRPIRYRQWRDPEGAVSFCAATFP